MPSKNTGDYGKYAGYLFVIGILVFALVMVLAEANFPCNSNGCYNIGTNPISDLGNTILSPLWPLFNYGLIIFGMMLFAGVIFLNKSFPKGAIGSAGMVFMMLSALGAIGVGTVPENTILAIHSVFAAIAFFAGGIGVLFIGIEITKKKGASKYSIYSIISGLITVLVFLVFTLHLGNVPLSTYGPGFGFGAIERIIAFPLLIWIFVTGIVMLKRRML